MEELLERAMKAGAEAEVFSISNLSAEVVFEANRLKQVQTKESKGTALRLIREGRIGFSATSRPDSDSELLRMALEMAPFGAEARFEFPSLQSYSPLEVFDPKVESISEETMVELGQSLIDRVRSANPEIICEASIKRSVSTVDIVNSRGGEGGYRKSVFSIAVGGVLVRGTDMLFVGDHEVSCHPVLDPSGVSASTLEQLERAKDTSAASKGNLPVIFTPHGVASALIPPLVSAFNGKTVLRGASPLGHRKQELVFTPELSIWDDPTIQFCPAGFMFDDEGIPGQRKALVENGVVMNFLYDLQTAGQAGTRSTGNASRSSASLPSPSTSSLIISEGKTSFADMLTDIKDGLVIEQLMGATQGNLLGGDFSGNVLLGYKIQNGQIAGRVKNTMVSGNVYDILKEGIVIGNDSRWLGGSLRTPSIYCPAVAVAAED